MAATRQARKRSAQEPFVFLHVGDLHVDTDQRRPVAQRNRIVADLGAILDDIRLIADRDLFDFVYLPGDLAENGCKGEYDLILAELARVQGLPIRLIPGDHDRQTGVMTDFAAFYRQVAPRPDTPVSNEVERPFTGCPPEPESERLDQFYFHEDFGRVRCFFVDMISAGYGRKGIGLDFRLGDDQTTWLERGIADARRAGFVPAVFMHAYPADMRDGDDASALAGLFRNERVSLVEMGHTHYNELACDGRTVYAAARSVGQNEDGPTGYAVCAIDGDVVSWRFKQLQLPWPFVMITSPADRRLANAPLTLSGGLLTVTALVLSDQDPNAVTCRCRVDGGRWIDMDRVGPRRFRKEVAWPEGSRTLSVKAKDGRASGHDYVDVDEIEPPPLEDRFVYSPLPAKPGSDEQSVGRWTIKGLRGDQLGPNRYGRKW